MYNKLLANKKIAIVTFALLLVLSIGIIILVTSGSKEVGQKDNDTKIEQSDENEGNKDGNGENIEVLKPNETTKEDSSDASGSWDDETDDKAQTNQTDETNTEDDGDGEENILADEIIWGDIY